MQQKKQEFINKAIKLKDFTKISFTLYGNIIEGIIYKDVMINGNIIYCVFNNVQNGHTPYNFKNINHGYKYSYAIITLFDRGVSFEVVNNMIDNLKVISIGDVNLSINIF